MASSQTKTTRMSSQSSEERIEKTTQKTTTTRMKQTEKRVLRRAGSQVEDVYRMSDEEITRIKSKKRNLVAFRGQIHGFNNHVYVKVKVSFKKPRVLKKLPIELRVGYVRITRRTALELVEEMAEEVGAGRRKRGSLLKKPSIDHRSDTGSGYSSTEEYGQSSRRKDDILEEKHWANEESAQIGPTAAQKRRLSYYEEEVTLRRSFDAESIPFSRRSSIQRPLTSQDSVTEETADELEDERLNRKRGKKVGTGQNKLVKMQSIRGSTERSDSELHAEEARHQQALEEEMRLKKQHEEQLAMQKEEEEKLAARKREQERLQQEEERKKQEELKRKEQELKKHREQEQKRKEEEQKRIQEEQAAAKRKREEEDKKKRQEEALKKKQQEEEMRLKKQQEEEMRLKKQHEEELRLKKQKEEEMRLKKQQEDEMQLKKKQEAEMNLKKQQEEEVRLKKQQEEEQRIKKIEEERLALRQKQEEQVKASAEEKKVVVKTAHQENFSMQAKHVEEQHVHHQHGHRVKITMKRKHVPEDVIRESDVRMEEEEARMKLIDEEERATKIRREEEAAQAEELKLKAAKKQEEEAKLARKKEEEMLAKKRKDEEELAKKQREEELAKKRREEEELAKKRKEEELAKERKDEEELAKKQQEEGARKREEEGRIAKQKAEEKRLAQEKAEEEQRREEEERKKQEKAKKLREEKKLKEKQEAERKERIRIEQEAENARLKEEERKLLARGVSLEDTVLVTTKVTETESADGEAAATKVITTRRIRRKPGVYRNVATQTVPNTYYKEGGQNFWEQYRLQKEKGKSVSDIPEQIQPTEASLTETMVEFADLQRDVIEEHVIDTIAPSVEASPQVPKEVVSEQIDVLPVTMAESAPSFPDQVASQKQPTIPEEIDDESILKKKAAKKIRQWSEEQIDLEDLQPVGVKDRLRKTSNETEQDDSDLRKKGVKERFKTKTRLEEFEMQKKQAKEVIDLKQAKEKAKEFEKRKRKESAEMAKDEAEESDDKEDDWFTMPPKIEETKPADAFTLFEQVHEEDAASKPKRKLEKQDSFKIEIKTADVSKRLEGFKKKPIIQDDAVQKAAMKSEEQVADAVEEAKIDATEIKPVKSKPDETPSLEDQKQQPVQLADTSDLFGSVEEEPKPDKPKLKLQKQDSFKIELKTSDVTKRLQGLKKKGETIDKGDNVAPAEPPEKPADASDIFGSTEEPEQIKPKRKLEKQDSFKVELKTSDVSKRLQSLKKKGGTIDRADSVAAAESAQKPVEASDIFRSAEEPEEIKPKRKLEKQDSFKFELKTSDVTKRLQGLKKKGETIDKGDNAAPAEPPEKPVDASDIFGSTEEPEQIKPKRKLEKQDSFKIELKTSDVSKRLQCLKKKGETEDKEERSELQPDASQKTVDTADLFGPPEDEVEPAKPKRKLEKQDSFKVEINTTDISKRLQSRSKKDQQKDDDNEKVSDTDNNSAKGDIVDGQKSKNEIVEDVVPTTESTLESAPSEKEAAPVIDLFASTDAADEEAPPSARKRLRARKQEAEEQQKLNESKEKKTSSLKKKKEVESPKRKVTFEDQIAEQDVLLQEAKAEEAALDITEASVQESSITAVEETKTESESNMTVKKQRSIQKEESFDLFKDKEQDNEAKTPRKSLRSKQAQEEEFSIKLKTPSKDELAQRLQKKSNETDEVHLKKTEVNEKSKDKKRTNFRDGLKKAGSIDKLSFDNDAEGIGAKGRLRKAKLDKKGSMDEKVDLRAGLNKTSDAPPVDLFGSQEEDEVKSKRKGLRGRAPADEEVKIKIDTSQQDAVKQRLMGLKKTPANEEKAKADESEKELDEKVKTMKDRQKVGADAVLESVTAMQVSMVEHENISSDVLAALESTPEETTRIGDAMDAPSKLDNEVKPKKVNVRKEPATIDLFGGQDEEEEDLKSKRKGLRGRKTNEEDEVKVKIDTSSKDAMQSRLKSLKSRKESDTKPVEKKEDDFFGLKGGLKKTDVSEAQQEDKTSTDAQEQKDRLKKVGTTKVDVNDLLEGLGGTGDSKEASHVSSDILNTLEDGRSPTEVEEIKATKAPEVQQQFVAGGDGEAVDLKAQMKGLKKKEDVPQIDLFGVPDEDEDELCSKRKGLRARKSSQEPEAAVKIDTSQQDALKQRLLGLKKKPDQEKSEEKLKADEKETELGSRVKKLSAGERERQDKDKKEVSAIMESISSTEAALLESAGHENLSADILANLAASQTAPEMYEKKEHKDQGVVQQFVAPTDGEAVDLKSQLKGLTKKSEQKEITPVTDLFGNEEPEEDLRSSRKGLRRRKQNEEEEVITIKLTEDQEAVQKRLAGLKQRKISDLEQKEQKKKEEEQNEYAMLKTGLKSAKDSRHQDADEVEKDEAPAEFAEAVGKLTKTEKKDKPSREDISSMIAADAEASAKLLEDGKASDANDILQSMNMALRNDELERRAAEQQAEKKSSSSTPQSFVLFGEQEEDFTQKKRSLKDRRAEIEQKEQEEAQPDPLQLEVQQRMKSLRAQQKALENQQQQKAAAIKKAEEEAAQKLQVRLKKVERGEESSEDDDEPSEANQAMGRLKKVSREMGEQKAQLLGLSDAADIEKMISEESARLQEQLGNAKNSGDSLKMFEQLSELEREEQAALMEQKAALAAKAKESSAMQQQFIVADGQEIDLANQLKGLAKKSEQKDYSAADLFGSHDEEEEERKKLRSMRKGLRQRKEEEQEAIVVPEVNQGKEEVAKRLERLKQMKTRIEEKKVTDKKIDAANEELAELKSGLRSMKESRAAESASESEDESAEIKSALTALHKTEQESEKPDFLKDGQDISQMIQEEAALAASQVEAALAASQVAKKIDASSLLGDIAAATRDDDLERRAAESQKKPDADSVTIKQSFIFFADDEEEVDLSSKKKGLRARLQQAVEEQENSVVEDPYEKEVKERLKNLRAKTKELESKQKEKNEAMKKQAEEQKFQSLKAGLRSAIAAKAEYEAGLSDEDEVDGTSAEFAETMGRLKKVSVEDLESNVDPELLRQFGENKKAAIEKLLEEEMASLQNRLDVAKERESEDMFKNLAEIQKQEEDELRRQKEEVAARKAEQAAAAQQFILFDEDAEAVDLGSRLKGLRARQREEEDEKPMEVNLQQEEMKERLRKLKEKARAAEEQRKNEELQYEIHTAKEQQFLDLKSGLKHTEVDEEERRQSRKKFEDDEPFEAVSIKGRLKKRDEDEIKIEKIDTEKLEQMKALQDRLKNMKKVENKEEEERKARLMKITEDDFFVMPQPRDHAISTSDMLSQLEESERALREQQELFEQQKKEYQEDKSKQSNVVASYLGDEKYESHIIEDSIEAEAKMKEIEMDYKMKVATMKARIKDKGALAFDWDQFLLHKGDEKEENEEEQLINNLRGNLHKTERKFDMEVYSDDDDLDDRINWIDDDDDEAYIRLYLEMCAAKKTCQEYMQKGTCRHIYYLCFEDFRHKNCKEVEEKGECNHLRGLLWRWISKYDGQMDLKLRAEVEFAEYEHFRNCPVTEKHGACFHCVDVMTSFRTKKENWELAYMHRVEFDEYFHEDCQDYITYGTCGHVDGISLNEFSHKECNEFMENGKCSHLWEIISRCTSKFTGEELIIRSEFVHDGCEEYDILGKCYHIEDLISRKVFYEDALRDGQVDKFSFMEPMQWEGERAMKKIWDLAGNPEKPAAVVGGDYHIGDIYGDDDYEIEDP